jgi:hypothetical protein
MCPFISAKKITAPKSNIEKIKIEDFFGRKLFFYPTVQWLFADLQSLKWICHPLIQGGGGGGGGWRGVSSPYPTPTSMYELGED